MSRDPMPIGTHGSISIPAYLGDVLLTGVKHEGENKTTWYTPDGDVVSPKNVTWKARTNFRDNDGRTRKVEGWGESQAAALRNLQEKLASRKRTSSDTITPETRLEALADYWIRTKLDAGKLSVNTKKRYRYTTQHYVVPGLGGLRLRECTVARLERWVAGEAEKHQETARQALTCLKGMFDTAVREDAIDVNPARSVTPIPTSADTNVRALSVEEVIKLRTDLVEDRKAQAADLGDLVDVMLGTGCRIGEAVALRWCDVDLDGHIVYLTGTVVRDEVKGLFRQDTTKGKKPRGHLVPKFTAEMLARRATEKVPNDLDLVFPSARSGLREVTTVGQQWIKFRKRHPEWEWIVAKTFRKSVGTAVKQGADIEAAAAQLGHANSAVTARHYVERPAVGPDHRDILERFGG